MFLYWCILIPVRRLLHVEGFNVLSFSSFAWKGATTPLALVLAEVLVLGADLQKATTFSFLPGTTFHKFSNWIHEYQSNIKYICINQFPLYKPILNQPITSQNTVTRKQYQQLDANYEPRILQQ